MVGDGHLKPRIAGPQAEVADATVVTDSAKSTMIVAAVTLDRPLFIQHHTVAEARSETLGPHRANLFAETNLIYGMETLALLVFLCGGDPDLKVKAATFHIDNENAINAVIKCNSKSDVITAMDHLIWHRIRQLGLTQWFEWVPSNRNIADLPTRGVRLPFHVEESKQFKNLRGLYRVIGQSRDAIKPVARSQFLGFLHSDDVALPGVLRPGFLFRE